VNVESRFSMRVFAFILPIRGSVDLDHRSLFLSSTNYRLVILSKPADAGKEKTWLRNSYPTNCGKR
jgi:hypothetical protein